MLVQNPSKPLVIATDWRQKADKDLDFTEPKEAPHVLDLWRFGMAAMGQKTFLAATRIALFDHDARPSTSEAAAERASFLHYIEHERPRVVLIIPTPSAQMGEMPTALRGTHVWNALRAPDSLEAMRGCQYYVTPQTRVVALHPAAKRLKELQRWVMARWMKEALSARPLRCKNPVSELGADMTATLQAMQGRPLAVDLEFIPSWGITTAIGVSDGIRAVSVPWDTFTPSPGAEPEQGLVALHKRNPDKAARILNPLAKLLGADTVKYAHNFVADVPRLREIGFTVNGQIHDTFAAHAIAFPELPHNLQAACASVLAVPPWKSLYKPRSEKHLTKDDVEFWTCQPKALRAYNCDDAFMTWHLAQKILPWIEVDPRSGNRLNHDLKRRR